MKIKAKNVMVGDVLQFHTQLEVVEIRHNFISPNGRIRPYFFRLVDDMGGTDIWYGDADVSWPLVHSFSEDEIPL